MAERWNLNEIREWKRFGRDLLAYGLAAFLVVYATLHAIQLGISLVAACFGTATVFLGLPHMLRIDRAREDDEP